MTAESSSTLRVGEWAALAQVVLAAAYILTGLAWLASAGPGADPFRPADPFLAVLEVLIILCAVGFIFIAATAQATAHEQVRVYGIAGLAFAIVFAALTCSSHFAQLTVIPRLPAPIVTWPSVPMVLDLLAWDLFFGLSLVCISVAVWDQSVWPRHLLLAAGLLCMAGLAGPASRHLKLHLLATIGYAAFYPAACVVLWLRLRGRRTAAGHARGAPG